MGMSVQEILLKIFYYFSEMDLPSQKKVLPYSRIIITTFSIIGFIIGYFKESFQIAVYANLLSILLCIIIFVPAWPMWKKESLKFLDTQAMKKKTN